MKFKLTIALLTAVAVLSTTASAITIGSLEDLATNGGSLTIGDKTYSDFSYAANGLQDFVPANIAVRAKVVDGIYLLVWAGNISVATPDFITPATASLSLFYTVTASGGQISSIDQIIAAGVSGGTGTIKVEETVTNAGGQTVGNSSVSLVDISDPSAEASDHLDINPGLSQLRVGTVISLEVVADRGELGLVSVSVIQQSFHQTVPDGGSGLALLGASLLGLAFFRRKLS